MTLFVFSLSREKKYIYSPNVFGLPHRKVYLFPPKAILEMMILIPQNLFVVFRLCVTPSDGFTRGGPPWPPLDATVYTTFPLQTENTALQQILSWFILFIWFLRCSVNSKHWRTGSHGISLQLWGIWISMVIPLISSAFLKWSLGTDSLGVWIRKPSTKYGHRPQ